MNSSSVVGLLLFLCFGVEANKPLKTLPQISPICFPEDATDSVT